MHGSVRAGAQDGTPADFDDLAMAASEVRTGAQVIAERGGMGARGAIRSAICSLLPKTWHSNWTLICGVHWRASGVSHLGGDPWLLGEDTLIIHQLVNSESRLAY